jgi:hypothetical protein
MPSSGMRCRVCLIITDVSKKRVTIFRAEDERRTVLDGCVYIDACNLCIYVHVYSYTCMYVGYERWNATVSMYLGL